MVVRAGANDGMLHAFHAGGASDLNAGNEAWAFIPTFSLPKLYKLASEGYSNDYVAFIDGTPVVNDICASDCAARRRPLPPRLYGRQFLCPVSGTAARGTSRWMSLIPQSERRCGSSKWSDACFDAGSLADQFTDCHVGLSYGDPVIASLRMGVGWCL